MAQRAFITYFLIATLCLISSPAQSTLTVNERGELQRIEKELENRYLFAAEQSSGRKPIFGLDPAFTGKPNEALLRRRAQLYTDYFDSTTTPAVKMALSENRRRNLAGTVAIVDASELTRERDGSWTLANPRTLAGTLCRGESLREETSLAMCSGFLVRDRTVVTAGHCIEDMFDAQRKLFVFGFDSDPQNNRAFSADQVFEGVLQSKFEDDTGGDYAIIELRESPNRAPLVCRTTDVDPTETIYMISHPGGTYAKEANGNVTKGFQSFFMAEVDVLAGSSGAPVFDVHDNVIGILTRGEADYVPHPDVAQNCSLHKVCRTSACRGEDITRITLVPF